MSANPSLLADLFAIVPSSLPTTCTELTAHVARLLFMGATQTHGAEPWRSEQPRMAVLHGVWGARMVGGRRPRL